MLLLILRGVGSIIAVGLLGVNIETNINTKKGASTNHNFFASSGLKDLAKHKPDAPFDSFALQSVVSKCYISSSNLSYRICGEVVTTNLCWRREHSGGKKDCREE
jgi:hypothetical protein